MMDGRLFDCLEAIARALRGSAAPFGGIQLIMSGDFHQAREALARGSAGAVCVFVCVGRRGAERQALPSNHHHATSLTPRVTPNSSAHLAPHPPARAAAPGGQGQGGGRGAALLL